MDELDLAILREMMGPKRLLYASFDPRVPADAIARRLRVDPSTVRARLRAWAGCGFLVGRTLTPNPRVFGASVYACGIEVDDVRAKPDVLARLALVDGLVHTLEHVGPWIGAGFVVDHPAVLVRRGDAIRAIPGVRDLQPFFEAPVVPVAKTLSPLEWRVLAAAHAEPDGTLAVLARRVGVSVNTLHARYRALVDADAFWSSPTLDFTKYTGGALVRLLVVHESETSPSAIAKAIEQGHRRPLALQEPPGAASDGTRVADFLLHLDSAASVEDVEVLVRAVAGVRETEALVPRRLATYDAWAKERLAERLAALPPR